MNALAAFRRDEGGAMMVFGLYMFVSMLVLGGIAIDVMNAYRMRTTLQVSADAAAHAAIYTRASNDVETAKARAIEIAEGTLPSERYGTILTPDDIVFGTWDEDEQKFTPDANSKTAVLVTSRMLKSRANSVGTFLLKLVGVGYFDLNRDAVFMAYQPGCLSQGFVARNRVYVRSNNTYVENFCIHSNDHVAIRQNNTFEPGVIVSMPNLGDLDLPASGFQNNPGLQDALRTATLDLSIVDQVPAMLAGLATRTSEWSPDYIKNSSVINLNPNNLKANDFKKGRIHRITCNGSGNNAKVTIPMNTLINEAVVLTNCEVKFAKGVRLEDAVMATSSTSPDSFNGSSGVQVGRNDNCADGGGAKLITRGGMRFPAKLAVYGGQLLAQGTIQFAAQANGIEGASFIAGDEIEGTSNMTMGYCSNGAGAYEKTFYRLVL